MSGGVIECDFCRGEYPSTEDNEHDELHTCPACAARTDLDESKRRQARDCGDCDRTYYAHPKANRFGCDECEAAR